MQLNDVHHDKEFLTFNSLHPNISVNILQTVLYTFPDKGEFLHLSIGSQGGDLLLDSYDLKV